MSTATMSVASPSSGPMKNPIFRLLWIGSTISLVGDQFYLVALPWLILQLTGSGVALGAILMAAAIPRAVLMLMGGAVTDRTSPRKVMIATASARTVFVGAIAALIYTHSIHLWHLYLLAFGFGVADAFYLPATSAFLPTIIERDQLVAANSVLQSRSLITSIAGPTPAALILKALGAGWAFLLDAISFLFVIGALWKLPDPPQTQTTAKPGLWSSIVEGLKYVNSDVALRSLMLLTAVLNFCMAGPITVGLAYLTKQKFASPTSYGICISAVAGGLLVGTLIAGMFAKHSRGPLLLWVSAVLGVCTASIGLLKHLWLIAAMLFIMGTTSGLVSVHINAWFQQRVDRAKLGRVASVAMFASIGLMPISLAIAGLLVQWSVVLMFFLSGASVLIVTSLAAIQRTVREIQKSGTGI